LWLTALKVENSGCHEEAVLTFAVWLVLALVVNGISQEVNGLFALREYKHLTVTLVIK
jgi:hypothetical protein